MLTSPGHLCGSLAIQMETRRNGSAQVCLFGSNKIRAWPKPQQDDRLYGAGSYFGHALSGLARTFDQGGPCERGLRVCMWSLLRAGSGFLF